MAALALSAAPWAPPRGPLGGAPGTLGARRAAVAARARYSGGRRWWSDAWEDEGQPLGFSALDGGSSASEQAITTIFCSDGSVVRLGATPHPLQAAEKRRAQRSASLDPLPLPSEQGLCIGSLFSICATNGVEPARRLHLLGFCFSAEQLAERVEDTVLSRGGEVWEYQCQLRSGVHERLTMKIALPYLFGVPPEFERLKAGICSGGGIIDRVEQQWFIF